MSVNSSSSNDSLLSSTNFTFNSLECYVSSPNSIILTTFSITKMVLLLPLSIIILYHGLQQWCKKNSTSAAKMSHSDSFIYHMVIMELIGVLGCFGCCCSIYKDDLTSLELFLCFYSLPWYGQIFFHTLTCVERYLAVVHPITYLSLRKERGIRMRNVCIGCVWLLCIAGMWFWMTDYSRIANTCLLMLTLTIISFCSLSVLCVLIRPGPGAQGGDRKRVDQSKQRAFYTIVVILGVLLLRFSWSLFWILFYTLGGRFSCVIVTCDLLIILPSSLVLPLLFLYRRGKLVCSKHTNQRA